MNQRNSREELMHMINTASFVVDDTKLFLDTHPDNQEALAHFREYSHIRNQAMAEYAQRFSPLTIDTA